VQSNRIIPSNKSDIIICVNEKGSCLPIDIAISEDRSMIKKEAEKILKYKDLTTEIQCMLNVKTKAIRATGTISKSFSKYLSNILRKHEIKELQKTTIFRTAHTLLIVLLYKYKTFNIGNNNTCTINCNNRIAATLCTLDTWLVAGV
jgi:hypothetical protein